EVKIKVEVINAAAIHGVAIDGETAEWLSKIGDAVHAKLARAGLVELRKSLGPKPQGALGEFLECYIAGRTDVKPRTRINLDSARRRLVEYFGEDKALEQITAGDAKDWAIWLNGRYARGTMGRTIKRAKQFFQAAIDKELISKNPFSKIRPPSQVN